MRTGIVKPDLEAVLRLMVHGPAGQVRRITAAIDTGYDGWLTLSPALIADLGLPWQRNGLMELADGTEKLFDIYQAVVLWDKRRKPIAVDEADAMPLIGMALLEGYELNMQVRARGKVSIKPLR